jgi:hypothetical protein
MAGALATRERAAAGAERGSAEPRITRLFDPHGPTLEDRVVASWDELAAGGCTECPVCGGSMSAAGCESCGSELS